MIRTVKESEMITIHPVMSEYPLSLGIAAKELCLYDWELDSEIIAIPLTDAQITAIQERSPLDSLQAAAYNEVLKDAEKGLSLAFAQSETPWLILCEMVDTVFFTDIVILPLTTEQLKAIQDAVERAVIYDATHDEEGNVILPLPTEQMQYAAL